MAKDDYDVIVFKVLSYLYACLKRKILFDRVCFEEFLTLKSIHLEYFADVLRMMGEDGLIEPVSYIKAWGSTIILTCDMEDLRNTSRGIDYLNENDRMKAVRGVLLQSVGMIAELVKIVFS